MEQWRQLVHDQMEEAVPTLQAYVRQPSIAAQHIGIPETVKIVVEMMEKAGGKTQVLADCGGNPVVYGVFEPGPNGNPNKTLLYYNHYDVQPPEPLDEWTVPPFDAVLKEGKLYGRGVSDNKADLVVRLQTISILQKNGGLPCRVKFLVEGEEEIGSPTIEKVLEKHAGLFKADACIWEFGGKNKQEQVEMVAGVKGICYMQFWVHGADVDIHSSMGAAIDNPAWRLVQALASMRTVDNRIVVEGFYDNVERPSEALIEIAKTLPTNAATMTETYGLKRPLITGDNPPSFALMYEPTMTISGLESGYTAVGCKTVLPKRAQAKVDCRLVPNQVPEDIVNKVRKHLDNHEFTDVEVELLTSEKAYRSDITDPFITAVVETARDAYGAEVVLSPNSGGSGPMHPFGHYLDGLPIVSTGCGWWNSRAHAPDESIRLSDFEQAMMHQVLLLQRFAK